MMHFISKEEIKTLTSTRDGEVKIGQKVQTIQNWTDLQNNNSPYVLLGIEEDIGIRANLGNPGAQNCWNLALKAILNTQNNRFLKGETITVAGSLQFPEYTQEANELDQTKANDLKRLRDLTSLIDSEVKESIQHIVKSEKVPIVIGGGHNNAFGNICGTSAGLNKAINVLNIDPHTDYRSLEGRHSGNGFSYAKEEGALDRYAVYGLHEGYNGADIIDEFYHKPHLFSQSFESILWASTLERDNYFKNVLNWLDTERIGLELDLDSITSFPVSAANPSGFSLNEVRNMIRTAAALKKPYYFHICEGSPKRAADGMQKDMLAKSIAYLVSDFIKSFE